MKVSTTPSVHALLTRRRSWAYALLATAMGLLLYHLDNWNEVREPDRWHAIINGVELAVMGPALGLLAFLISESFRQREARFRQRVEHEQRQRFQFLGRIAAGVAHEIRNPLNNLHLIGEEMRPQVPASTRALLDRMIANLIRIDHATALIYELAKPARSGAEGDGALVRLVDLTRETVRELAARPDLELRVEEESPSGPMFAAGRTESVRIILQNLIRNAAEAAMGSAIAIAYRQVGDQAQVRIANPGSMPAEALAGLDVASRKPAGLGIGLTISRHLAAHCGGRIELSSDHGVVVAILSLPAAA